MSKHEEFAFQRSTRSEQRDPGVPDQSAKIAHRSTIDRFASVSQVLWVCGRGNRSKASLASPVEFK